MTVAETEALSSGPYAGNGSTVDFDYDFKIYSSDELEVLRQNADGTVTTLSLTTDYTVSGVGDDGGGAIQLTAGSKLPTGATLTIEPDVSLSQLRPFSTQTSTTLDQIEKSLDKLTSLIRQVWVRGRRAVRLSAAAYDAGFDPVVNSVTANATIVVNADGDGLAMGPDTSEVATNATSAATSATSAATSATSAASSAAQAQAASRPYHTRAIAEAANVDSGVEYVSVLAPNGTKLEYVRDTSGTALTTGDGANWSPAGLVRPDHWKENTTPGTTLMGAAINSAVAFLEADKGGHVHFSAHEYLTDETISITRNVHLVGENGYFLNDYVNDAAVIRGSVIKMASGSNVDVVRFRANVSELSGSSFPRQHAGLKNIMIHGNRSENQNPSQKDLNSSGIGVLCQGTSYIELDNVVIFRCAEHGARAESYDHGDGNGSRGCNNLNWRNVAAIGNGGSGFSLFPGDSTFVQLVGGYNNDDGFNGNCGPLIGCKFWNNQRRGVSLSTSNNGSILQGCDIYDNGHAGLYISGEYDVISGCKIFDNGQKETGVASEECGIYFASGANGTTLSGNTISPNQGDTAQKRGVHSTNSPLTLYLGSNRVEGHATADWDLTSYTGIRHHSDIPSASGEHPGFTLTGNINADDFVLNHVGALTFDNWKTVTSLSSGALAVGNDSLVNANISAGGTVTDLNAASTGLVFVMIRNSNATPLTFQHDSAKLRLLGGADVKLEQHESIMFADVNGTVWQQIGGAKGHEIRGSVTASSAAAQTIFDAGSENAVWEVFATHAAGDGTANAVVAKVIGDTTTPVILQKDTTGAAGFDLSVSGTNIQLTSTSATNRTTTTLVRRAI